ncbi:hypothetical protein BST61_g580 [Cercospora zeina]
MDSASSSTTTTPNYSVVLTRRYRNLQPQVKCCRACQLRRKVDPISGCCTQCATQQRAQREPSTSTSSGESDETILYTIDQRSMQRNQLLYAFLQSYFPSDPEPEVWLARHMSPLLVLPELDLSSPMMSSAIDTLCLAHMGRNERDRQLVYASQDAYGKVLSSMRRALSGRPASRATSREVIASCLLMSVYNDSIPGSSSFNNYATHLFGAAQYAQACRPSCLDPSVPFDQKLLMWLRFQSLFVCVARRKTFFWSQHEWRAMEARFDPGGSRSWYPLLVPLPGLLELADRHLRRPGRAAPQVRAALDLCRDLDTFREKHHEWAEVDFAGKPGIVYVTDPDDFDMEIEEHLFMTTSSAFTSFHAFHDAAHAMRCMVSWFMALVSDCTLLRLLAAYPSAQDHIKRSPEQVEQKAFQSATEICRSVCYYSMLNSLAYAHLLCVVIDLVQVFFEEFGALREAGWCQACLIATDLRLQRVRHQRHETLCRVGDLNGAFTKACRYRTMPVAATTDWSGLSA